MATEVTTQCRGFAPWGSRCRRPAVDENGLCGPHRAGERRRATALADRQAQRDAMARVYAARATQAAYVTAWRERHPLDVWGGVWTCPLCDKVIQLPFPRDPVDALDALVNAHTVSAHGQDWLDYQRAGQEE